MKLSKEIKIKSSKAANSSNPNSRSKYQFIFVSDLGFRITDLTDKEFNNIKHCASNNRKPATSGRPTYSTS